MKSAGCANAVRTSPEKVEDNGDGFQTISLSRSVSSHMTRISERDDDDDDTPSCLARCFTGMLPFSTCSRRHRLPSDTYHVADDSKSHTTESPPSGMFCSRVPRRVRRTCAVIRDTIECFMMCVCRRRHRQDTFPLDDRDETHVNLSDVMVEARFDEEDALKVNIR